MKIYKIVLFTAFALLAMSCKKMKEKDPATKIKAETEDLVKVTEASNSNHIIELYTKTGDFKVGYNQLYLRVKDKSTQKYENNLSIAVNPMMNMTSMSHACPVSSFSKTLEKINLYNGYVVFQMASNATEFWELTINYSIDGTIYTATKQVAVNESAKRRLVTFTGTDNVKYVMALVNPESPRVGVSEIQALLFKMESMTSYPIVNNFLIKIDPRMPSMGNHGSPNNQNLTQINGAGIYNGSLSMTMTGYWKINLQVLNENLDVLKGEEITPTVESSSIFFEIEF